MDHDRTIPLLIVSVLWCFTVAALVHAVVRRIWLDRRGRLSPDYADLRLYTNDQVVLEMFRLAKHTIIVVLLWMTPHNPSSFVESRNVGIVVVSVLLGVTSAWSLYRRHVRFQRFKRRA